MQGNAGKDGKVMSTTHLDALINRMPSNFIKNIKPFDKNLEIKFIILSKGQSIRTKQGSLMTPLHIADSTGSMQMNVYDDCKVTSCRG